MLWPILKLIRFHEWLRRLPERHRIPLWLTDVMGLVRFIDVPGWITTFIYSGFYPQHFYRRAGHIAGSSSGSLHRWRYPYLLRPVPYLIAFVALLNLLRFLGVSVFGETEEFSAVQFNIEILAITLSIPFVAIAVMLGLIVLVAVVKFLAAALDAVTSSKNKLGEAATINWWFFRLLFRKRFWTRYRYGELIPALLYYSINAVILVPTAFVVFVGGAAFVIDLLPELERDLFKVLMQALKALVVTVIAIVLVYYLVLRPMLYAVLFRADSWLLRHGVCPDFLDLFGDPERDPSSPPQVPGHVLRARVAFVDVDMESTDRDDAYLRWVRVTDAGGRVVEDDLRRVKRLEKASKGKS